MSLTRGGGLTRRRALQLLSGAAVPLWVACSGSKHPPSAGNATAARAGQAGSTPAGVAATPSSSLVAVPQDTSASAKTGGTYRSFINSDLSSFDLYAAPPNSDVGRRVYSRLLTFE